MIKLNGHQQVINQMIDDLELDAREYSGRVMYGKTCLGITTSFVIKTVIEMTEYLVTEYNSLVDYMEDDEKESVLSKIDAIQELLENMKSDARWDNMGLQMIVYFPRVSYEKQDDDEEE